MKRYRLRLPGILRLFRTGFLCRLSHFPRGLVDFSLATGTMSAYRCFPRTRRRGRWNLSFELVFKFGWFQNILRMCLLRTSRGSAEHTRCSQNPGLVLKKCLRTFWNHPNAKVVLFPDSSNNLLKHRTHPYHCFRKTGAAGKVLNVGARKTVRK